MFLSSQPVGNECREWAIYSPEYADPIKKDYCLNLPNAPECKCILRTSDPEYNKVKISYPDGCWYLPCSPAKEDTYLQLNINKSILDEGECGSACQQIVYLYGTGEIKVKFTTDINCIFPDSINTTSKSINNSNNISIYYDYILIGLIIFLLIVLLGSLIIYVYK